MVARPDDLSEVIELWKKDGRIGDRLELMQSSVARRLLERDQSRAEGYPLSSVDALFGARRVAAVATMTRESTIRVPDGSVNLNGIDVASILPDWDDKKVAALLARPIFDEAIYQTVRFHHRTVREYLTAEWFKALLDRETSRRKIESLFFREQYGQEVLVPTMRPVLVWLILLDQKICDRALAISPELVFEGGEPKVLPLSTRRKILSDVCRQIHAGVTRGSATDYRSIQRFADRDIAAEVKALISRYRSNNELQWFLLRMVWQGELVDCLPEAKQAALNPRAEHYERIAAFRAVLAIGGEIDRAEVRDSFLKEASVLNRAWFAELLNDLPATKLSVDWALACLKKLAARNPHEIEEVSDALDKFADALDADLLVELLNGLSVLVGKRPVLERRYCEVSKRHGWLMDSAARVVEKLTAIRHPMVLQPAALSILRGLSSAQDYADWNLRKVPPNLPELVYAWPELNDALFWYGAAQARRFREKKSRRVNAFWQVMPFGSYWRFAPEDFERILSYVELKPLQDDRLIALSLAFRLYVQARRPRKWREAMHATVAESPVLRDALNAYLHPPPLTEKEKRERRQHASYERRWKNRKKANEENEQKWKGYLTSHVAQLRDPALPDASAFTNSQHYLLEKMRQSEKQSMHWTDGKWEALETEFGREVAHAFRDWLVAYWRNYVPKLRSERKSGSGTPFKVVFGLAGIAIEAREAKIWAKSLGEEEAEIAFRYAMEELNGFPVWMPSLFAEFPKLITKLLLREVDYELRIEKARSDSYYVLSDLSWNGSWAWRGIGEGIFDRLKKREPANLANLGHMLNIVHRAGVDTEEIARLAEVRSRDRRHPHAAYWYAVWMGQRPDQAFIALSDRLAGIRDTQKQISFAMQFVVSLMGGRRSSAATGAAFRVPKHLKDLYILMHKYVRRQDDIERAGKGVYSPGLRDNAQDARNQLFEFLREIPGKEAYLALMELAQLDPDLSFQSWIRYRAKSKAEQDADLTPWTVDQSLEFQSEIERTPVNHRELFELIEMRFLDLKDNLEHGDSSIADILIKGAAQETDMRKYIGEWLRERARGRYAIPQEEELADDKRIDLRIHGKGFDAPVPAELKLADKWTGPKLFERLENQLCGDYLRDNRSSRGLFVLVHLGEEERGWTVPGVSKQVDFAGLADALQQRWVAISPMFPGIDDIRVIGIDLTVRRNNRQ